MSGERIKFFSNVGGRVIEFGRNIGGGGSTSRQDSLVGGKPSEFWNHANSQLTFQTGHGFVDGDVVDLHWSTGRRLQMVCSGVTSIYVTVADGHGADLPPDSSITGALVLSKRMTWKIPFDGSDLRFYCLHATRRAAFDFLDANDSSILTMDVNDSDAPQWWYWRRRGYNAMLGKDVAKIVWSNGTIEQTTATFQIWTRG